jgi:hypothetical protein
MALLVVGLAGDVLGIVMSQAEMVAITKSVGDAASLAKTAMSNAAAANAEAGKAQFKADSAVTTAKAAGRASEEANASASKALSDADSAKGELDTVEKKRAALEDALKRMAICNAPRDIDIWFVGGKHSVDPLRPYKGSKAVINFVPDAEARRAASRVYAALKAAEWDVGEPVMRDGLPDGVLIEWYGPAQESVRLQSGGTASGANFEHAQTIGEELTLFLHSFAWQAVVRDGFSDEKGIPPNGIRILVGLYPAVPYVVTPGNEQLAAAMEERNREQDEFDSERKAKHAKELEEFLSKLSPEKATEYRERERSWQEIEKREKSLVTQPCHPLNDLTPHFF